eukprot:1472-Hanusia_phi.AAC.1
MALLIQPREREQTRLISRTTDQCLAPCVDHLPLIICVKTSGGGRALVDAVHITGKIKPREKTAQERIIDLSKWATQKIPWTQEVRQSLNNLQATGQNIGFEELATCMTEVAPAKLMRKTGTQSTQKNWLHKSKEQMELVREINMFRKALRKDQKAEKECKKHLRKEAPQDADIQAALKDSTDRFKAI